MISCCLCKQPIDVVYAIRFGKNYCLECNEEFQKTLDKSLGVTIAFTEEINPECVTVKIKNKKYRLIGSG